MDTGLFILIVIISFHHRMDPFFFHLNLHCGSERVAPSY